MIPPVIHYVWIKDNDSPPEDIFRGIRSAILNTKCKVVIHTDDLDFPPVPGAELRFRTFNKDIKGIPWEDAKNTSMKGYGKRIAHISDIYRLEILFLEGGIYSDFDVLWLRNPWEFFKKKVVIGFGNKGYKILCNAIMMAEQHNKHILAYKNWLLEIYPSNKYWIPANPYKLWKDIEDITMIDKYYFYPISWDKCSEISYEKIQKSIAVHTFKSMGIAGGSIIEDILWKNVAPL